MPRASGLSALSTASLLLLTVHEFPYRPPHDCRTPPSDAEKAKGSALYSTYVKLKWKRERIMARDLQRKIALKWAAIAALPTQELKLEALEVDPFIPLRLRPATITPPLKGFQHDPFEGTPQAAALAAFNASVAAARPAGAGGASAASAAPKAGEEAKKKGNEGGGIDSALSALRRRTAGSGPSLLSSMRAKATAAAVAAEGGAAPPAAGKAAPKAGGIPSAGGVPRPGGVPSAGGVPTAGGKR